MTQTATKRHSWTKDEIKLLNQTVKSAKSKGAAFEIIADKMGVTKSAVAGTYYNNQPKKAKADPKPTKKVKGVVTAKAITSSSSANGTWHAFMQQGRPYEYANLSESELLEFAQGIRAEVARRQDIMNEIDTLFTR